MQQSKSVADKAVEQERRQSSEGGKAEMVAAWQEKKRDRNEDYFKNIFLYLAIYNNFRQSFY